MLRYILLALAIIGFAVLAFVAFQLSFDYLLVSNAKPVFESLMDIPYENVPAESEQQRAAFVTHFVINMVAGEQYYEDRTSVNFQAVEIFFYAGIVLLGIALNGASIINAATSKWVKVISTIRSVSFVGGGVYAVIVVVEAWFSVRTWTWSLNSLLTLVVLFAVAFGLKMLIAPKAKTDAPAKPMPNAVVLKHIKGGALLKLPATEETVFLKDGDNLEVGEEVYVVDTGEVTEGKYQNRIFRLSLLPR